MPKDEFDFEDPFELNRTVLLTHEDSTTEMAACFIEEFRRMGYGHKQLLALFRNPQYFGPHLAYQERGEPFIRDLIAEVFARWGKNVTWAGAGGNPDAQVQAPSSGTGGPALAAATVAEGADASQTDPMGAAIPKLNL